MKNIISSILFICISLTAQAKIDTLKAYSKSMQKEIPNLVILPSNYSPENSYPVVYLLHGHGNNYTAWSKINKNIEQLATDYGIIIVCPDGATSWYWDSPIDKSIRYETYVTQELLPLIDSTYSTSDSPTSRAITGLSMGGHGGLWLGIRHPDLFGACGSMSGGVDIRPFPNNWDMKKSLGEYKDNPEIWDAHTVINLVENLSTETAPKIIICCGVDDFFYQVNIDLHEKLLKKGINHDFIIRPGAHNAAYWKNALPYQLLFFKNYFIAN